MTPRSARSTGVRPLRRDAERNRQQILLAARAAFAERGLEVTLDEIAQRAGVGVGTVYRRYSNKDELIDELFERAKQSGRLRPDVTETDMATIVMMLGAVIDSTRTTQPDAWRRYLGIVLDGLRTRRNAPTDLTPVAPGQREVDAAPGTITRRPANK